MRWLAGGMAALVLACDPLLEAPRLPEPSAALVAPFDAEIRQAAGPVAVAVRVDRCREVQEIELFADERRVAATFRPSPGGTLTATVAPSRLLAAGDLADLALPGERRLSLRVRGRCADFDAPFESPARRIFVSPFDRAVTTQATVRELVVLPEALEGRDALFALTDADLRQMGTAPGLCTSDFAEGRPLQPCWVTWSARPARLERLRVVNGVVVALMACDEFSTGRACPPPPPGASRASVLGFFSVENKLARAEALTFTGCDVALGPPSPDGLVLLTACDGGPWIHGELTVDNDRGRVTVTRGATTALDGAVLGSAAGSVFTATGGGRLLRWDPGPDGLRSRDLGRPLPNDAPVPLAFSPGAPRLALVTTPDPERFDAPVVVELDAEDGTELRRWRLDAPARAIGYAGDDLWVRGDRSVTLLGDEARTLSVAPDHVWQAVGAPGGVWVVTGGVPPFTTPARVLEISPAGEVTPRLAGLEAAVTAELVVPGNGRLYGALGDLVFTLTLPR